VPQFGGGMEINMNDVKKIRRNILIFAIFCTICGWIGYLIDLSANRAHYENIGTNIDEGGSLGLILWLISPMICTIILRTFGGDGWKNAGFAPNLKDNKMMYLISFLIYPTVTLTVVILGTMTGGIRFLNANITIKTYIGILFVQIATQFIKNIFEESVWRAYLTNQLLKLKLSDLKIYLLVGFIWWIWHLPYIMIFLSESEIYNVLPVGRGTFFLIGFIVVTCWSVMYTEIFRITKTLWPLVIAHTMEDAVINPLLLMGILSVEKSQAIFFSLSVGIVPTILYLTVGLTIRRWRKKQEQSQVAKL